MPYLSICPTVNVILVFPSDSRCRTLRDSVVLLLSVLFPELVSRRRDPGCDPESSARSLQRRLHPPGSGPSSGSQDGPLSCTKNCKRRAPGESGLEPTGHFCFLEPFTPWWGVPVFPAVLGGVPAPLLGLNLQLQLYIRRQKCQDVSPSLQGRAVTRRGRKRTDFKRTLFFTSSKSLSFIWITCRERRCHRAPNHTETTSIQNKQSQRGIFSVLREGLGCIPHSLSQWCYGSFKFVSMTQLCFIFLVCCLSSSPQRSRSFFSRFLSRLGKN